MQEVWDWTATVPEYQGLAVSGMSHGSSGGAKPGHIRGYDEAGYQIEQEVWASCPDRDSNAPRPMEVMKRQG